MIIDPDGMVRVQNNTSDPIFLTYHSRTTRIAPNKSGFVSFPCIQYYLGDPRSGPDKVRIPIGADKIGYIQSRNDELERLSILYGVYNANDIETIRSRAPQLSVFSVEDNSPITMPMDDPKCLEGHLANPDDATFIEQQLHTLKQQQLVLQQMLENREHERSEQSALLPEDQSIAARMREPLSIPDPDSSIPEDKPSILTPK